MNWPFFYHTWNLKELEKVWKQINRQINQNIKDNKLDYVIINTKILLIIYSSYCEVIFNKLLNTPNWFSQIEIGEIQKKTSITEKWKETLKIAISKVDTTNFSNRDEYEKMIIILDEYIDEYIDKPSKLRNKIAHWQIKYPLNKKWTNINSEIKEKIDNIDCVKLKILKESVSLVVHTIEILIQSPNKKFKFFYEENYKILKDKQIEFKNYSFVHLTTQLLNKKSKTYKK